MPRTPIAQLQRLDAAIQNLEDEVTLFTQYADTSTRIHEVNAFVVIWCMRDRFVVRYGLEEHFIPSDSMTDDWEPESNE